jgi:hypothetical protein
LPRYAEALLPGFVGLYQANAQSTRSLTGRAEAGGVLISRLAMRRQIKISPGTPNGPFP